MDDNAQFRATALNSFERARRQAQRKAFSARLKGGEVETLLPFDLIRAELRHQNPLYRGIQQINIDKIVGSVGRANEFTRTFLPLNDSLKERWVGVESLAMRTGWPPVDAYQVGDVFFVKDGNHRVAVARQMQSPTVEAAVWQFPDEIEIQAGDSLDDILIQLGAARFETQTHLLERYPTHELRFTTPGNYNELLAQIEELRRKLAIIDGEEKQFEGVVPDWYELIYLPTVQIIRESTLLQDFPGRTESDLFVWLSHHRDELGQQYGEFKNLSDLAQMLAERYREGRIQRVARQARRLLGSEELPSLPTAPDND